MNTSHRKHHLFKLNVSLAACLSLVWLSACTTNHEPAGSSSAPPESLEIGQPPSAPSAAPPDAFPKTLTVDGRTVVISEKPQRIAALSIDAAEAVLEMAGADRVVVVPRSAANADMGYQTEEARKVQHKIASATSLDPEEILSYDSDLLIMTKVHDKEKDAETIMQQAGIPIVSLPAWNTFEQIWTNYRLIGQAIGEEERAEQTIAGMKKTIDSVQQAIRDRAKPSVLVISPLGPGTGPYFIGNSNISYDIVRLAGGSNAADELGLTRVTKASIELIIKADPEYILLIQWKEGDTADLEALTDAPGWSTLQAVQKGNVKKMTVKKMFYPNRYNADSVKEITHWLHPESFQ